MIPGYSGFEAEFSNFAVEVTVGDEDEERSQDIGNTEEIYICKEVQSNGRFSINFLESNPRAIHYYTGLNDIQHFRFFLDCLGPAAFCLMFKSRILSEENELFLCLIKLRLNKGTLYEVFLVELFY